MGEQDYDFMELIQNYWYHFSECGNPHSQGAPNGGRMNGILTSAFWAMTLICSQKEQEKYAYYYGRLRSGEVFPAKEMMRKGLDCGGVERGKA